MKRSRLKLKAEYVAIVALLAILVILCKGAYWEFWPLRDSVFRFNSPIRVTADEVTVGGTLTYYMDYYKNPRYSELRASVIATFVDHVAQPASVAIGDLPAGSRTLPVELSVPSIMPGVYRLIISRDYTFSPTRHETYTSISQPFRIKAAHVPANEELLLRLNTLLSDNKILTHDIIGVLRTNRTLIEAIRKR